MKRSILLLALVAGAAFAADVNVEQAWARATVPGQQSGGAFLTVTSAGGDRLLGGRTPAAERVELHTMKMEGTTMRMRQVDAIVLPPGQPVKLEPGHFHLMFVGLKAPLKAGEKLPLALRFEKAGEVNVEVQVSSGAGPLPSRN
jgi:copper(I)-binding protein